jgi:2-oxoglutarate dehydrogenase E2 component (dihydrolipoamide succinyltransferase)
MVNVVVPDMGESVTEATVLEWRKKVGDRVAISDIVVELETDKVNLEVGAPAAGVISQIVAASGADVKVGDVLAIIEAVGSAASAAPSAPATAPVATPVATAAAPAVAADRNKPAATPVAERAAQVLNVDVAQVPPSRADGKVVKQDVERFATPSAIVPASLPTAATPSAVLPPAAMAALFTETRREERVPMSRRRQTIARRLVEAQHNAAMLTTFNEVDMTHVQAIREKRKNAFKEKYGVSLGLSSFFVKATIAALKLFPRLNAEIQGTDMVLKHYYDIGMAIGAEEGLVVPILRDADRMTFAKIELAIKDYAKQVQDGTLPLSAITGGSFTITNGGIFGSLMSTPILNPPQVGILGLHGIKPRPVVVDNQIVIRPMMYTALSYDHRIVDGREAVQFLVAVKDMIEDPERLLIEG